MPRFSELRTNLALLRNVTGLNQAGFANDIGLKLSTVQNVESGRAKLTEEQARQVAAATFVDLAWLLSDGPPCDPVMTSGAPYTRNQYENARAQNAAGSSPEFVVQMLPDYAASFYGQLRAILSSAAKAHRAEVAVWKVGRVMESLRADFGNDEKLMSGKQFAERADRTLALKRRQVDAGVKLMRDDLKERDRQELEDEELIAKLKADTAAGLPIEMKIISSAPTKATKG